MSIIGSPGRVLHDFRASFRDSELKGLLFFVVLLIIGGTLFYMIIEDWGIIEAFYFCVATLTTVGYGDLHPTSDVSRLFTAFYALAGVGFILGFVTVMARRTSKSFAERIARERSKDK